jgi:ComEC/Rec2-related protein
LPAAQALLPWFAPLLLLPAGPRGPGRRLQWVLRALGFALVFLRLPALPAPGQVVTVRGHWETTLDCQGPRFSGRLREQPSALLRGLGRALPAPGAGFSGRALVLPAAGGGRELRLLAWRAGPEESAATRASRLAGPDRRTRWARRWTRHFPPTEAPLARAFLLGERRGLPWRLNRSFRDAGIAHILAVSGQHVALFLLMLRLALAPALGSGGAFRAEVLMLALLPLLLAVWGGAAPVLRAILMAGYLLLWRRRGGRPHTKEALGLAALCEFLLRPSVLLTPGFQLSYLATFALLVGLPRELPPLARGARLRWQLRAGLRASLLCSAAVLPVLLLCFRHLPLLGPLWNLVAGVFAAPALGLGWAALPLAPLPGAAWGAYPAALALRGMAAVATWAGGPLALVIQPAPPPAWTWLAWSLGFHRLASGRLGRSGALLLATPLLALLARGAMP